MSLIKLRSNHRSFQIKLGNFYPKKMALTMHSSVPKNASPRRKCHGLSFLSVLSALHPLFESFGKRKGKGKGEYNICLARQGGRRNGQTLSSLSSPRVWQAPERVLSISVLLTLSLQCPAGHSPWHSLQRELYCTKDLGAGALVFLLL